MIGLLEIIKNKIVKIHNYLLPRVSNGQVIYKTKTFNHHYIFKNAYINYLNNIDESFLNKHKENFKNCLSDINNNNHILLWVYKNNSRELLKYKLIVLDFKNIYDYKNKVNLNFEYASYLSEYLHNNKIILCIISEIHPKYFPKIKYFNDVNLITPFHYKKKSFGGGVIKIGLNQYSNKSIEVSLKNLILDIMNQYGIQDNEIVYVNSEKVSNINTFII